MSATLTTTVSFNDFVGLDGAEPVGDLIADANGDLFGATAGGANNDETVGQLY